MQTKMLMGYSDQKVNHNSARAKQHLWIIVLILVVNSTLYCQQAPITRQLKWVGENQFSIEYIFTTDTLKGFFMVVDSFSQNVKLVSKKCDYPIKYDKKAITITGEQIVLTKQATFFFKNTDSKIEVFGFAQFENFPNEKKRFEFPNSILERPVQDHVALKDQPKIEPISPKREATLEEPDSSSNITFRVQLAASKSPMNIKKLEQLANQNLPVLEEFIDGYYKYTIGQQLSMNEANQLLKRIPVDQFKKPFIVAYQGKRRVTMHQAMNKK